MSTEAPAPGVRRLNGFLAVATLLAASVLVQANRFPNLFVWDDSLFREATDPVLYEGLNLRTTHTRLYRPLRVLAYTALFSVSGREELGYHLFATLVHAFGTLAVYALLRGLRLELAFAGALIFAVHPVHVESVVFITASFDQMAVVLYLASLTAQVAGQRGRRWGFAAALGCAALALLGSEFAVTLAPCAALVAILLWRREGLALPKRLLALHAALLVGYLVLRFGVIGLGARSEEHLGGDLLAAAASTSVIFVRYLGLLLWPWPSCMSYQPAIHRGFLELAPAASTLLLTGLTAASAAALWRGRPVGLGFLWFLLALAPVSNLVASTTPMAERYLYLPSAGLAIVIACMSWGRRVQNAEPPRVPGSTRGSYGDRWIRYAAPLQAAVLAVVVLAFGVTTWKRTALWRDDTTLFSWAVECESGNSALWSNLGLAQIEAGDPAAARASLQEALRLKPDYADAWVGMGRILEASGGDAVELYRRGMEKSGGSAELSTALCGALLRAGRLAEAEEAARRGLEREPDVAELHGNLGEALLRQGRAGEAREAIAEGLRLQPQHPELWATLAECLLALGLRTEALGALERAVALPLPSSRAEYNLGVLLEPASPRRAAAHFRNYLRLEPRAADAGAVQGRITRLEAAALPSGSKLLR